MQFLQWTETKVRSTRVNKKAPNEMPVLLARVAGIPCTFRISCQLLCETGRTISSRGAARDVLSTWRTLFLQSRHRASRPPLDAA